MSWLATLSRFKFRTAPPRAPLLGLALGGGFARGIAHLGVLRVLLGHNIPVHMIAGVSAGAICAAAYASGTELAEIERMAKAMRFKDVARWTVSRLGLAGSERMGRFLKRLLAAYRFEDMRIPLAVVATDLCKGRPVAFQGSGDVILPVRASCSYPGLFQPLRIDRTWYVDGAMSLEVPAPTLKHMGATHVISVELPVDGSEFDPRNMFQVVSRCFQIMHCRTEADWRRHSDVIIEPEVGTMAWDSFVSAEKLIEAGEAATEAALPAIREIWPAGWKRRLQTPAPAISPAA